MLSIRLNFTPSQIYRRQILTCKGKNIMTQRLDYRTIAPEGMKTLLAVHAYTEDCGLPHTLLELVNLRCSQINGCAYCLDMHSKNLLKAGVSIDKLMLVSAWHEARELFSEKEQAALTWAERLTRIAD